MFQKIETLYCPKNNFKPLGQISQKLFRNISKNALPICLKSKYKKMIKCLINFKSPTSANLGSQNLPKWSQDGPSLVKNVILSKSKNPSNTLARPAKMRVGGSQDELLGALLAF